MDPADLNWDQLSWSEAQHAIVEFLHENGFMSFHEMPIYGGRADGFVIKKEESRVTKMIIEVKHYKRISDSTVINAVNQGLSYLKSILRSDESSREKSNKEYRYILLVVFSNDYPVKRINPNSFNLEYPYPVEVIYCSARNLKEILQKHGIIQNQTNLDDYF